MISLSCKESHQQPSPLSAVGSTGLVLNPGEENQVILVHLMLLPIRILLLPLRLLWWAARVFVFLLLFKTVDALA